MNNKLGPDLLTEMNEKNERRKTEGKEGRGKEEDQRRPNYLQKEQIV